MTPETFKATLDAIGWSQRHLAARLGTSDATVRRWASGAFPVPHSVASWLSELVRCHVDRPAPTLPGRGNSKRTRSP